MATLQQIRNAVDARLVTIWGVVQTKQATYAAAHGGRLDMLPALAVADTANDTGVNGVVLGDGLVGPSVGNKLTDQHHIGLIELCTDTRRAFGLVRSATSAFIYTIMIVFGCCSHPKMGGVAAQWYITRMTHLFTGRYRTFGERIRKPRRRPSLYIQSKLSVLFGYNTAPYPALIGASLIDVLPKRCLIVFWSSHMAVL